MDDLINEASKVPEKAGKDDKNKKQTQTNEKKSSFVSYPNHVFITIRGQKDCKLQLAAQLTVQPEAKEEDQIQQNKNKKKNAVDPELMERVDSELK